MQAIRKRGKRHCVCRAAPERKSSRRKLLCVAISRVAVLVFDGIAHDVADACAKGSESEHEHGSTLNGSGWRRHQLTTERNRSNVVMLSGKCLGSCQINGEVVSRMVGE